MRRLFSTFSSGPPGVGLLLLRLIAGATLIVHYVQLQNGASLQAITSHVIAALGALLLLAGLWTPVTGAIVAITELWIVFSHVYDPWVSVLLVGLGAALRCWVPGPGRGCTLYGWKRIEIRRPDK